MFSASYCTSPGRNNPHFKVRRSERKELGIVVFLLPVEENIEILWYTGEIRGTDPFFS